MVLSETPVDAMPTTEPTSNAEPVSCPDAAAVPRADSAGAVLYATPQPPCLKVGSEEHDVHPAMLMSDSSLLSSVDNPPGHWGPAWGRPEEVCPICLDVVSTAPAEAPLANMKRNTRSTGGPTRTGHLLVCNRCETKYHVGCLHDYKTQGKMSGAMPCPTCRSTAIDRQLRAITRGGLL